MKSDSWSAVKENWDAFVELGEVDIKRLDDETFNPFEDWSVGFGLVMTGVLLYLVTLILTLLPMIQ